MVSRLVIAWNDLIGESAEAIEVQLSSEGLKNFGISCFANFSGLLTMKESPSLLQQMRL